MPCLCCHADLVNFEAAEFCATEFIHGGYRRLHDAKSAWGKVRYIVRSAFQFHNESINVWSHFCGGVLMIVLAIYTLFCWTDTYTHMEIFAHTLTHPANYTTCTPPLVPTVAPHTYVITDKNITGFPAFQFPSLHTHTHTHTATHTCADDHHNAFAHTHTHTDTHTHTCSAEGGKCADTYDKIATVFEHTHTHTNTHTHTTQKTTQCPRKGDAASDTLTHTPTHTHTPSRLYRLWTAHAAESLRTFTHMVLNVETTAIDLLDGTKRHAADWGHKTYDQLVSMHEQLESVSGRVSSLWQQTKQTAQEQLPSLALQDRLRELRTLLDRARELEGRMESYIQEEYEHLSNQIKSEVASIAHGMADRLDYLGGQFIIARWPVVVFLSMAVFCLFSSAAFHLFGVYSKSMYVFLLRLDYSGIVALITGSCVPVFYYGFYCKHTFFYVYTLFMCTIASALIACILSPWFEKLMTEQYTKHRIGGFIGFGFSAVVPMAHILYLNWFSQFDCLKFSAYIALMGFLYITGALLYAFRIPERYFPGRFDLVGASHQIMHVFIVAAAFVHYQGTMSFFEMRMAAGCPA